MKCRRIRMSDILALHLALLAGALLGAFFFGGLWWTVQKGVRSERPALWFLGSMLLRTCMILAGFYYVSQGHWSRLVVCLLGFVIARVIVVKRLTRATAEEPTQSEMEARVAPQSR
jgi:F1F0 ATPase subunit 2